MEWFYRANIRAISSIVRYPWWRSFRYPLALMEPWCLVPLLLGKRGLNPKLILWWMKLLRVFLAMNLRLRTLKTSQRRR